MDTWNVLTHGQTPKYRTQPGSTVQPLIPAASTSARTYQITYYPRDVRRNVDNDKTLLIEESFDENGKKYLEAPKLAGVDAGSAGMKNPDVQRYDPSGLRTAMTTNWTAMNKELARSRPNHLPFAAPLQYPTATDRKVAESITAQGLHSPGIPRDKRPRGYLHSLADQW